MSGQVIRDSKIEKKILKQHAIDVEADQEVERVEAESLEQLLQAHSTNFEALAKDIELLKMVVMRSHPEAATELHTLQNAADGARAENRGPLLSMRKRLPGGVEVLAKSIGDAINP